MIWRVSFVALLLGSLLIACGNRVEQPACPVTKNKALSAGQPTPNNFPAETRPC